MPNNMLLLVPLPAGNYETEKISGIPNKMLQSGETQLVFQVGFTIDSKRITIFPYIFNNIQKSLINKEYIQILQIPDFKYLKKADLLKIEKQLENYKNYADWEIMEDERLMDIRQQK